MHSDPKTLHCQVEDWADKMSYAKMFDLMTLCAHVQITDQPYLIASVGAHEGHKSLRLLKDL